jgi:uracil-DNA glycosylase
VVGESPSRAGDRYHHLPLSGAPAQTLCTLAGIPPKADDSRYGRWTEALYDKFDCVNAVRRFPSGGWPRQLAARSVAGMLEPEREVVVLLGSRVRTAYDDARQPATPLLLGRDRFEWIVDIDSPTGRREVVVLPHPSGLNRMLNDPATRRRMGEVLREAIEKAAQMEATRL